MRTAWFYAEWYSPVHSEVFLSMINLAVVLSIHSAKCPYRFSRYALTEDIPVNANRFSSTSAFDSVSPFSFCTTFPLIYHAIFREKHNRFSAVNSIVYWIFTLFVRFHIQLQFFLNANMLQYPQHKCMERLDITLNVQIRLWIPIFMIQEGVLNMDFTDNLDILYARRSSEDGKGN